jgi:hypothetical protein
MRSHAFPVSLQIVVALRFYATGSFQQVNADVHNISKGSVSNITKDVTQCLNCICRQYIKMPTDKAELRKVMHGFHDIANFPNVVGAIDGTHIRIRAPSADENFYVNRKNYHSINVMGVCDASMRFLNIVAKCPGGTHDAFIWSNSTLCEKFEDRTIRDGWLLGDSGYPLRPWLLTPVLNPTSPQEVRYNEAHMKTRSIIERSFGLLKSRFRCIDTSGGTLLYTPLKCCDIVIAVVVLHNLCIIHHLPLPANDNIPLDRGHIDRQPYARRINDGVAVRGRLINGRFR